MHFKYNVTTYPIKIVTTYPKGVILLEIPVHQTHAHKAVIYDNIYDRVYFIFLLCQFPVVVGYFWGKMNFRKCKKFVQRGKQNYFWP